MANSKKKKSVTKAKKAVKKPAPKIKRAKARPTGEKIVAKKQWKKPLPRTARMAAKTRAKKPFQKEIAKKLLKAKEDLLAEVAAKIKSESNALKFEIGDIYDIASSERERELTLMLGDRDREKLAEIEEAFERIKNGSYGMCEECGEPIGEGRLLAMPFTRVCIECKSKDEREKGAIRRYEEEHGLTMLEKTEVEEEEF